MADTVTNKVTLTLGYTNTDFTRNFIINDAPIAALDDVEDKAIAVNASLKAGTDGGLKEFFRSNDYDDSDQQNIIGQLETIKHVQVETVTETVIF